MFIESEDMSLQDAVQSGEWASSVMWGPSTSRPCPPTHGSRKHSTYGNEEEPTSARSRDEKQDDALKLEVPEEAQQALSRQLRGFGLNKQILPTELRGPLSRRAPGASYLG